MAGSISHVGQRISPSSSLLDEDPGIMSEAETSSTGFRRGPKSRSSLPIVRTPSKTFERPLGLVFLQFGKETKRALLPNEITSLDTVKALFVRSFPQQLSMEFLDSRNVRIYIHDSSKDMFYELEDLRDIRDRAVLRLFETDSAMGMGGFPASLPVPIPIPTGLSSPSVTSPRVPISPSNNGNWDQDLSYFSEPEFDSEYQHQHVHKAKQTSSKPPVGPGPSYYGISRHGYSPSPLPSASTPLLQPMASIATPGRPAMQRAFSSAAAERSLSVPGIGPNLPSPGNGRVYPPLSINVQAEGQMSRPMFPPQASPQPPRPPERSYSVGGPSFLSPSTAYPSPMPPFGRSGPYEEAFGVAGPPPPPYLLSAGAPVAVDEETRLRMEHVERQLASLTGLVQTALTTSNSPRASEPEIIKDELVVNTARAVPKNPRLGRDKFVSFEKSVSFNEDPIDVSEGKHSPQPTETKPVKPAIKSSTLPRAAAQVLPFKGETGSSGPAGSISIDLHNQLKQLQKRARDLRQEIRNLRRVTQTQAAAFQEVIKETAHSVTKSLTQNTDLVSGALNNEASLAELSWHKIQQDEESYHQEMQRLEKDLSELEVNVEDLRSNVINKKTRVNMTDVEQLIVLLSRSSKTIGTLKEQFPSLQDNIKRILTYQMDKVAEEEKFLAEEPGKLETAIRRCKKLTSTLVTLKRLASVQEQRQPAVLNNDHRTSKSFSSDLQSDSSSPANQMAQGAPACPPRRSSSCSTASELPASGADHGSPGPTPRGAGPSGGTTVESQGPPLPPRNRQGPENPLDALLDELETFSHPHTWTQTLQSATSSVTSSPRPSRRPQPPIPGSEPSTLERKSSTTKPPTYAETSLDDMVPPPTPTRRAPPPPPPRTSSRSPLMSPQGSLHKFRTNQDSAQSPLVIKIAPWIASSGPQAHLTLPRRDSGSKPLPPQRASAILADETKLEAADQSSRSSSSESVNSQEGASSISLSIAGSIKTSDDKDVSSAPPTPPTRQRQEVLEQRHQELLKKQRQLQEQYARLQQLQRSRPLPIAMGVSVLQQSANQGPNTSQETKNLPEETIDRGLELKQSNSFQDVPETDII